MKTGEPNSKTPDKKHYKLPRNHVKFYKTKNLVKSTVVTAHVKASKLIKTTR